MRGERFESNGRVISIVSESEKPEVSKFENQLASFLCDNMALLMKEVGTKKGYIHMGDIENKADGQPYVSCYFFMPKGNPLAETLISLITGATDQQSLEKLNELLERVKK